MFALFFIPFFPSSSVSSNVDESDGISATILEPRRDNVDAVNNTKLASLPGEVFTFEARDSGSPTALQSLTKSCTARKTLELKIGAQVILLKNVDVAAGLANGARGVVVRIERTRSRIAPVVRFAGGLERAVQTAEFQLRYDVGRFFFVHFFLSM